MWPWSLRLQTPESVWIYSGRLGAMTVYLGGLLLLSLSRMIVSAPLLLLMNASEMHSLPLSDYLGDTSLHSSGSSWCHTMSVNLLTQNKWVWLISDVWFFILPNKGVLWRMEGMFVPLYFGKTTATKKEKVCKQCVLVCSAMQPVWLNCADSSTPAPSTSAEHMFSMCIRLLFLTFDLIFCFHSVHFEGGIHQD